MMFRQVIKAACHGTVRMVHGVPVVQGDSYWHCQRVYKGDDDFWLQKCPQGLRAVMHDF
jgi:hypothetical protein